MSNNLNVTVRERATITASVSVKAFEAFLERAGWKGVNADAYVMTGSGDLYTFKEWRLSTHPREKVIRTWPQMVALDLGPEVERAAEALGMLPSAVLAEIVEEAG